MTELHPLDGIVPIIYLLGIIALGLWMARRVRNISDYFMPCCFGKAMMLTHAGPLLDYQIDASSRFSPQDYADHRLSVTLIDKICSEIEVDLAIYWEDLCYKTGPMISPDMFKRFLMPGYASINETLHNYGVEIVAVDSDGLIDELMPLWLDVGVNCMVPVEVGTWRADVNDYRKRYGEELLLIGGVDKRELAGDREQILAEVERVRPLVEKGGYIPMPDHLIPPNVSLDNYRYYLDCVRLSRA